MRQEGQLIGLIPTCARKWKRKVVTLTSIKKENRSILFLILKKRLKEKEGAFFMSKYYFSSESVTSGHPDKVCDLIADSILDEAIRQDPDAHMAG